MFVLQANSEEIFKISSQDNTLVTVTPCNTQGTW